MRCFRHAERARQQRLRLLIILPGDVRAGQMIESDYQFGTQFAEATLFEFERALSERDGSVKLALLERAAGFIINFSRHFQVSNRLAIRWRRRRSTTRFGARGRY